MKMMSLAQYHHCQDVDNALLLYIHNMYPEWALSQQGCEEAECFM